MNPSSNDPAQDASNTVAAIFGNILTGIQQTVNAAVVRNSPAPVTPAPARAPSFFSTPGGMVVGAVAVVVIVAYLKKNNS